MGRNGWKTTAESAQRIELQWLKNNNYLPKSENVSWCNLQWRHNGEPAGNITLMINTLEPDPHIRFLYKTRSWWETSEDAWQNRDYRFALENKPCRYGGVKWFIRCGLFKNGQYCGRRARILYATGNGYYGCRRCADITYESCNQGGRYKGFLSLYDLEEQEMRVKRWNYAGKPTRQHKKLLKMESKFSDSFLINAAWLTKGGLNGKIKL